MSSSCTTILSIPSQPSIPRTEIPPPSPYIQTQLEEYKTILFNILHILVDERTTTYDPVAYVVKWDSLVTYMVSVLHSLKYISSKSVVYSSKKQDLIEAEMVFVASNQEAMGNKQREMDDKMKVRSIRQNDMGVNLKVVLELLQKKP